MGRKESGNGKSGGEERPAAAVPIDRVLWHKTKEFLKRRVLHVDDSPERVARGVAVAFWVAFAIAPLLGLHIWVAILLAFVFRANKVSMLAFMWVHNPITMWPILYLNARVGAVVARLWSDETGAGLGRIADFLRQWQEEGVFTSMMQGHFWQMLAQVVLNVGTDVWIGGAILGAGAAAATYFGTKHVVIWYRRKKAYRRQRKPDG